MTAINSLGQVYISMVREKNSKVTIIGLSLSPTRFAERMTAFSHSQKSPMEKIVCEGRYKRWSELNEHIPVERLLKKFKARFERTSIPML
jgi:triosephosphate isomerase